MKYDKTIMRCYTVKISSVFRSSTKIHHFSRTHTIGAPHSAFARNGAIREIIRSRYPRFSDRLCGKTQKRKARSAEDVSVYQPVAASRAARIRAFTPPAQYKPGKHVGIINKKHDEHGYIHTNTLAAVEDVPSNELKSTRFSPKLDYPFLDGSRNFSRTLSAAHRSAETASH